METARILIIDDEKSVHNVIGAYLQVEGYEYKSAMDGNSGLEIARSFKPHVIVLDVMLPGLNGIDLMTRLRRESEVYVIMLSARTEEVDKIVGLSVGADDYLTKPFSPRELIARIKAALRRISTSSIQAISTSSIQASSSGSIQGVSAGSTPGGLADTAQPGLSAEEDQLVFAHIRISPMERRVWVDEQLIELTTVEFDLLMILAKHHGKVLSRQQLLEKVWGYDYYGDTRVVDVHIGHVRQKLGSDTYIETVRGIGYRFEDK